MILLLIYLTLYIIFDSYSDFYVQKKGKISHIIKSIVTFFNIGIVSYLAFNLQLKSHETKHIFYLIFVCLTYRWIFFDLCYNIFARNNLMYVGKSQLLQGWWSLAGKCLFLFFSILFTLELWYL